jgi:hypothetical protein
VAVTKRIIHTKASTDPEYEFRAEVDSVLRKADLPDLTATELAVLIEKEFVRHFEDLEPEVIGIGLSLHLAPSP